MIDVDLDHQFDRLVPPELRHLSTAHWTPARVAVRAVSLIRPSERTHVLDVGAGVGKVCTIGALSGLGSWVGVEQHGALVESATAIARLLGVADRTSFVCADAFSINWNEFDALYFYNPFEVQLFGALHPQLSTVQQRLEALPNFTRVVTLRGLGSLVPSTFELIYHEQLPVVGLDLAMWVQRTRRRVLGLAS